MKLNRILRALVFIMILASQFFLVTNHAPFVVPAFACYTWQVGTRVGVRGGSEIRSGSGLNYPVHTIVPEDNWQIDIIGGPRSADGKEWWNISRKNLDGGGTGWVYKEQAGYDICSNPNPPSNPGQVELVDNLTLRSEGSGQWPPVAGDKLVAHIKVRNSGGQTINLSHIGVRGRRNGSEFWDIGWWPTQLAPGQVWELNPNNERPLEPGNYSFRISYQDGSGWHEIGNEINFSVSTPPPPPPGTLKIVDNLSLRTDGSGQWPPQLGDKLVAHIKLQNTGGQALTLNNVGVRGRRNGSEFWDIGWWPVTLQSGQVWELNPNNERPLQDGNYSFRISYQDASGWHEIGNEINFSVSAPPPNPGQVQVVDNLSLRSDGSGQWPPVVGDKIVAHIKIQNTGGQTVTLTNIGVRGRRNGSEFWDIGWWPVELAPGQTWELNPNNERPLLEGSYSFRISYQDASGWHEIGNEINFSVSASPPPSAGQLTLVDNLTLRSEGSGQWPPVAGDKLIAHIKVHNSGAQTLNLSHIGVRGRRNGSEFWDIGWWPTQLSPGQVWELNPNNERPLEAGNYSFRISYQDASGWHEIGNEINFSVSTSSPPPSAGQVELVDNFTLRSDGSGQWPPVVGDKLVAHIKIQNTGGQALTLNNVGVRGRRNGNEFWDIGWWPTQLAPGQVWELNPNNERPLQSGNYSFRISYQDNTGWHEIGNEISFSVGIPSNNNQVDDTLLNNQPNNQPEEANVASNNDTQLDETSGGDLTQTDATSSSSEGNNPSNSTAVDTPGGSAMNELDRLEIERIDSLITTFEAVGISLELMTLNTTKNPLVEVIPYTMDLAQAPLEIKRYFHSGDRTDILKGGLSLEMGLFGMAAGLALAAGAAPTFLTLTAIALGLAAIKAMIPS